MCTYEGASENWMRRRPKNCLNTPPVAQKARSIVTSARDTPRDKMRSKCDQDAIKIRSKNYYYCCHVTMQNAGRRVKPVKPYETEDKTAWQACKTAKTVRFSKKKWGPLFV